MIRIIIAAGAVLGNAGFDPQVGRSDSWSNSVAASPACSPATTGRCVQPDQVSASESSVAGTGGPYEPVTEHSNSIIMDDVGGPVEERTGYPACKPGPGDDECIQLYEPGVSGRTN